MKDLQLITSYYNTNNPKFDLNKDNIVDIYDITKVSKMIDNSYAFNDRISVGGNFGNLSAWSMANGVKDFIYYRNEGDGGKLYKRNTSGSYNAKVCDDSVYSINIIGDWIYYVNYSDNKSIYKISSDGSSRTKIIDGDAYYIYVSGGWVYYVGYKDLNLYRVKVDGNKNEVMVNQSIAEFGLKGEYIYYIPSKDRRIYKIKDNGQNNALVTGDYAYQFNVVGDTVYYINTSDGYSLYKLDMKNSSKTKLLNQSLSSINVTEQFIYYALKSNGGIYKLDRNSGSVMPVQNAFASTAEGYNYLNLVGDFIYYFNKEDNILYSIKTDGSDKNPVGYYKLYVNGAISKEFKSFNEAIKYLTSNNTASTRIEDPSNKVLWDNSGYWIYNEENPIVKVSNIKQALDSVNKYSKAMALGKDGRLIYDSEKNYRIMLGYTQDDLILRPQPSKASTSPTEIPKGKLLEITDITLGFYKVKYYGDNGQVLEGYVTQYVDIMSDNMKEDSLGFLSQKYESDGNPGIISTGQGDYGGKSYGAWQLSSNMGAVDAFLTWLKGENYNFYNRLESAHVKDGGQPKIFGENFDNEWKAIAKESYDEFYFIQHKYTKYKYYDDLVARLKNSGGYEDRMSYFSVKNMLWSTAVQHGAYGAYKIINIYKDSLNPYDFINNIYDERAKVEIYFPSSPTLHDGLKQRFQREKSDDLRIYTRETNY